MPLFKFKHDEEAIKLANDTIYGLAAYFYTRVSSSLFSVTICYCLKIVSLPPNAEGLGVGYPEGGEAVGSWSVPPCQLADRVTWLLAMCNGWLGLGYEIADEVWSENCQLGLEVGVYH